MKTAVLIPAYGRRYLEKDDVLDAFTSNKDFIQKTVTDKWFGKYCNCSDLMKYSDYTHVELRYGQYNEHLTLVPLEAD
jgi:hypothetical protein